VRKEVAFELIGFERCSLDAAGQAAQYEPCCDLVDACLAAAQAATAVERLPGRESAQLFPQPVGSGHDHATQLREPFAADVDGASTSDKQQPQRLPPRAGARQREPVAGECRTRCPGRVEGVVFAA
jgi:hypothetical protein